MRKLLPSTDRDLIVLILVLIVSITVSVADSVVQLIDPTRSFVDFAVLFGFGWGMYQIGCMRS